MTQTEQAKEMVNNIYQRMGYLPGLNMNSKQMWKWASEVAMSNVDQIISAIQITTDHCTLRLLERQEVQMDIEFWESVKGEILKNQ